MTEKLDGNGQDVTQETDFGPFEDPFTAQPRRRRPNRYLVLPPDAPSAADRRSPVFATSPEAVAEAWIDLLMNAPRTWILEVSPDRRQVDAIQRSRLLGFPDRITARFVDVADGCAAAAILSRALIGYWDLGVNQRRVDSWLTRLEARCPVADAAGPRADHG